MMQFKSKGALALTALAVLAMSCATEPAHHGGRGHRAGQRQDMERPTIIVRPGAPLLIDLDADHDLRVSRAELESGAAALFAAADSNRDGSLSPLEFDALMQAHLGTTESTPGRLSFDLNADNAITKDEFMAGMRALFARFDTDGDGYVTRAEMIQRMAESPRPGGDGAGQAPAGVHHRRGP